MDVYHYLDYSLKTIYRKIMRDTFVRKSYCQKCCVLKRTSSLPDDHKQRFYAKYFCNQTDT